MKRVAVSMAMLAVLAAGSSCASAVTPAVLGRPSRPPVVPVPPTPTALALCRQVLPGRDVVSGTWTTVGDLRTWGYSGPVQRRPLQAVFANASPADQAAWCWTKNSADSYTAWGARANDEPQRAITVIGPTTVTPSGSPRIP
jgi:hypothetical protein